MVDMRVTSSGDRSDKEENVSSRSSERSSSVWIKRAGESGKYVRQYSR